MIFELFCMISVARCFELYCSGLSSSWVTRSLSSFRRRMLFDWLLLLLLLSKFTFSRNFVQGWWVPSSKVCFFAMADCEVTRFKAGPPLDLSFWSFLTFLHHGIEEVERHLLWKFYKKIRRKSWSNVPPKLVACIGFLYKVVHKIGRLRKFNRSRGI